MINIAIEASIEKFNNRFCVIELNHQSPKKSEKEKIRRLSTIRRRLTDDVFSSLIFFKYEKMHLWKLFSFDLKSDIAAFKEVKTLSLSIKQFKPLIDYFERTFIGKLKRGTSLRKRPLFEIVMDGMLINEFLMTLDE